jgi:hypothetical protein
MKLLKMDELKIPEDSLSSSGPIDWATVSRLPGLLAQVDHGIYAAQDLLRIIEAANAANRTYRTQVLNCVSKKHKSLHDPLKIHIAMEKVSESIEEEMKTVAAEIENIQVFVIDKMKEAIHEALVARKEAEKEFLKRKSICQNIKGLMVKKRKLALKDWESLQDLLRKLYSMQQALVVARDNSKKEKIQKNISKLEENIAKQKNLAKHLFLEVEQLVKEGSQHLDLFYAQTIPEYMKKLHTIDKVKNAKIYDVIISFSQISKRCAAKITVHSETLEETCLSDTIREEEISVQKLNVPLDLLDGPETLKSGLPFLAADIEKAIKVVDLKVPPVSSMDKFARRATQAFTSVGHIFKKNQTSSIKNLNISPALLEKEENTKKKSVTFSVNSSSFKSSTEENKQDLESDPFPSSNVSANYGALRVRAYSEEDQKFVDDEEEDTVAKLKPICRVVAISDYSNQVEESSEFLSFKKGDYIIVTDNSNSEWWAGYLESDQKMGNLFFPTSHVETAAGNTDS